MVRHILFAGICSICLSINPLKTISQEKELVIQKGHLNPIKSIVFSHNDQYLASLDSKNNLKIWYLPTGSEMLAYHAKQNIKSLCFSHDDENLGVLYENDVALSIHLTDNKIMNADTSLFSEFLFPAKDTVILTFGGNSSFRATINNLGIEIRGINSGFYQQIHHVNEFAQFTSIIYLEKDKKLLASNQNGKIFVFGFDEKFKTIASLRDQLSEVNELALSHKKNYFASCSNDRSIVIWDCKSLKPVKALYSHSYPVYSLSVSTDNHLYFGDSRGFLRRINLKDLTEEVKSERIYSTPLSGLCLMNSENHLLTGTYGNPLNLVNSKSFLVQKSVKIKNSQLSSSFRDLFDPNYSFFVVNKIVPSSNPSITAVYTHYIKNRRKVFLLDSNLRLVDKYPIKYDFRKRKGILENLDSGLTHQDIITDFKQLKNNNRCFTSSIDGTIKYWDLSNLSLIATFIPIDKDGLVVLTPDNYYISNKNLQGLGFKVGAQVFPPEQFDIQYNRPDIVLERLGFVDAETIEMYRKAYEKRLKKTGFNTKSFSSDWHIPEIAVTNKDELPYETSESTVLLNIKASDSKYMLDRLNVWVNDVPVFGINGLSLASQNKAELTLDTKITLNQGENKIVLTAINEKAAESYKETFFINHTPVKSTTPDLYLITIGVSDYMMSEMNLKYAVKDGRDIISTFKTSKNKFWQNLFIDSLFNQSVNIENLSRLKEKLLKTKVDDQVLLFVSGHGLLDDSLNFYFASHQMDFDDPAKKGIPYELLEGLLDSIPARKKVMLIDACHSGEVDKEKDELPVKNEIPEVNDDQLVVSSYNTRGGKNRSNEKSKGKTGLQNSFELMQQLFTDLNKSSGAIVIAAAAGEGYALESTEWKNGAFTYSLLNGLRNKLADKSGDDMISISELKKYLLKKVEEITKGRQKPTVRNDNPDFDFRVW